MIAGGLEDVSFTRASVSWGIPVPWEPSQTIYVWVDALLNYRTAQEYGLGRDVTSEFWPTSLHLMAKDILRLHGIIWPAMLLAAGYEPPRGLFVHGYFTFGGQKMSKTLGNVIDPFEVIELLGADALRYYLMREVQWGQDGDVTWEGLHRRYEGELANDLGNLVSRATAMIVRYRQGRVPEGRNALEPVHESVAARLDAVDLSGALEEIWTLVRSANRYVEEQQPWVLAKLGRARAGAGTGRRALHAGRHRAVAGRDAVPVHPGLRREDPGGRRRPGRHRVGAGGAGDARGRQRGAPARAAVPPRREVIDTHAHLERCEQGPDAAVAEAAAAGVERILTIGREQAVELAARHPGVWAIVGWHPHEAAEADVDAVRPLLTRPRVVALGEVGLDFYRNNAPPDDQRRVFAAQIELANELGLPLVIHTRDADQETFPMLERARVPVVLHCFSSPRAAG